MGLEVEATLEDEVTSGVSAQETLVIKVAILAWPLRDGFDDKLLVSGLGSGLLDSDQGRGPLGGDVGVG